MLRPLFNLLPQPLFHQFYKPSPTGCHRRLKNSEMLRAFNAFSLSAQALRLDMLRPLFNILLQPLFHHLYTPEPNRPPRLLKNSEMLRAFNAFSSLPRYDAWACYAHCPPPPLFHLATLFVTFLFCWIACLPRFSFFFTSVSVLCYTAQHSFASASAFASLLLLLSSHLERPHCDSACNATGVGRLFLGDGAGKAR